MAPDGIAPAQPFRRTRAEDRDGAARAAVVASQRGRIIEGTVEAVAEKGYLETTLADIVGRARVSRTTFYEHFANKEECVVAVIELAAAVVTSEIERAVAETIDAGRLPALRAMIDAYCTTIAAAPDFATVFLCEAPAAGGRARQAFDTAVDSIIASVRELHDRFNVPDPETPPLSTTVLELLLGGICEHTRRLVTRGDLAELPSYGAQYTQFAADVLAFT